MSAVGSTPLTWWVVRDDVAVPASAWLIAERPDGMSLEFGPVEIEHLPSLLDAYVATAEQWSAHMDDPAADLRVVPSWP